jgi:hypothetical protein
MAGLRRKSPQGRVHTFRFGKALASTGIYTYLPDPGGNAVAAAAAPVS